MSNEDNRLSWNRLSEHYQSSTYISLDDIHYGPYSPGERHFKLIGSVKGLDCLELGCGGGQISVVLAKWGASKVIGIDISDKQLEFAQSLARKEDVDVTFIRQTMEDLSIFTNNSFDLCISVHAISYAENINRIFSETARVLRPSGKFVFCILNPIQFVLWEALEENSFEMIIPYFTTTRDIWDWRDEENQKIASFGQTYHRFAEIINGLVQNGFMIERVVEPKGYSMKKLQAMDLNKIPYHDEKEINEKFVRVNQIIPFSLIISAIKGE